MMFGDIQGFQNENWRDFYSLINGGRTIKNPGYQPGFSMTGRILIYSNRITRYYIVTAVIVMVPV